MVKGRKPKPTHLKIIEGNPGKRRIATSEWSPDPVALDKPELTTEHASECWDRSVIELQEMGILQAADRDALEIYCEMYGTWRQAAKAGRERRCPSQRSGRESGHEPGLENRKRRLTDGDKTRRSVRVLPGRSHSHKHRAAPSRYPRGDPFRLMKHLNNRWRPAIVKRVEDKWDVCGAIGETLLSEAREYVASRT